MDRHRAQKTRHQEEQSDEDRCEPGSPALANTGGTLKVLLLAFVKPPKTAPSESTSKMR